MARNISKYTDRELEILQILWDSPEPIIASEIATRGNKLTINTTQAVLKSLLKKKLIEVGKIVYSGKVLSRSYIPSISQANFELMRLQDNVNNMKSNLSIPDMVAAFVRGSKKDEAANIAELEKWIEEKKKTLKK